MSGAETAAVKVSETVSQNEIEQLLSQFSGADSGVPEVPADLLNLKDPAAQAAAFHNRHQFSEHSFFSALELRKLRMRHEELIRYIGAQLASYLRLECVLQMSKLETMPFKKFMATLADPTDLTLFQLNPLPGACILEIPPRLGLCLVDRQLGGPALKVDNSRNLSEIEIKLVSRVAEVILTEWCSYWSSVIDLKPAITGHESNSRFVECSSADTVMLVLGITTWVGGEIMDEIQIAFPHYTIAFLVRKLAAQTTQDASRNPAPASRIAWNPALDDLQIPLSVELPRIPLSARALANLKCGDVIPFSPELIKRLVVRLGGLPKFQGELGAAEGNKAVRIASVLKNPKRLN